MYNFAVIVDRTVANYLNQEDLPNKLLFLFFLLVVSQAFFSFFYGDKLAETFLSFRSRRPFEEEATRLFL